MQKHNGPVSLHGSSSMRFDNLHGADAMSNIFDEMRSAIAQAKNAQQAADDNTAQMLRILNGRLRQVNSWDASRLLADLKKELSQFNARTGEWKS